MIRVLYSFVPMAAMVVMLICTLVYKSLDRKLPEIEAELEKRE